MPKIQTIKTSQLWERQDWDTEKGFLYFRKYYLAVPVEERSMTDSYARYRADNGLPKPNSTKAPGSWINWFNGKNRNGLKPKGSVYEYSKTWAQRANAYEDYLLAEQEKIDQALWIERRRKVRDEEWDLGEKLRMRAQQMLTAVLFEKVVDTTTGQLVLKPTSWSEQDITRTIDIALKLQRRAAEMDQGKISVEHDWKTQLEAAGIDAGNIFNELVSQFANGMAESSDPDS